MDYQWLLFDADGTLFNYDLAEEKALAGTFRDLGLRFEPQWGDVYRRVNRQVWIDFEMKRITAVELRTRRFELLFESIRLTADAARFSARYLQNLACASDLIDGAEETLRELHGRFHLAVITNGLQDVQRPRLANSPIGGLFDLVAISEEIGAVKPDPGFFEHVFVRMGNPPRKSVLVIGDSLTSDIQGGINYGLDTCWYNPACLPVDVRFPATYEVQELRQLIRLVDG